MRQRQLVSHLFFLVVLVDLGCAKETNQNQLKSSKAALNDTTILRNTSRPNIERRQPDFKQATNISIPTTISNRIQTTETHTHNISSRLQQYPSDEDTDDYRVPFWNIAHMINSIEEIEPALRAGANGIETDISFDELGQPNETFHGFPCDCGRHCFSRESFVKFIQHVGHLKTLPAASSLQLVVLDLKLKDLDEKQKLVAGKQMAAIIDEYVYRKYLVALKKLKQQQEPNRNLEMLIVQPPVRFVISINHVQDGILIRSFQEHILENHSDFMGRHVGFDVGMNDNLTDISSMWDQFNGTIINIWQGDGLTNCANIIRGVERLKQAVSIRNGQGHFKKVYYWTADVMYLIRSVLRFGLDALLTNQPQRVLQALEEPEFNSKYRLATVYDDPFAQFWIRPTSWKVSMPTLSEAVETVANIRKTGEQYVKTLPNSIAGALQKVQESIIPG